MKKSHLLGAVCACLAIVSFNVSATLIERTFDFSVTSDLIYDSTDNAGNIGKEIEFFGLTDAFFLHSGDTLVTHINFDKSLLIKDAGTDFWASSTGSITGSEPINFIYWFTDGASGAGSVAEANISYDVTFDVLGGIPASSSLTGSLSTGGGGTTAAHSISSNITDSILMINGIDIVTNINSYALIRNDGEYSRFTASISASHISIAPVPEPPVLYLLAPGLLGLIGIARKKYS